MKASAHGNTTQIDQWQRSRQRAFKAVPEGGRTMHYLGKRFHVYPDTFWPFLDSQPLVRKLRVGAGESVLDVGTGSGVIAIHACYLGAARVLALDVNPAALRSAARNAVEHGFGNIMETRASDLFEQVGDERFDVITANLPFRDKAAPDVVARSQWDTGFQTNTRFFEQVGGYLKPGGRIYFAHSNFGAPEVVRQLAAQAGFSCELLATSPRRAAETREFYAFLMQRAGMR
jgi:release factor glutamine methyltransferase